MPDAVLDGEFRGILRPTGLVPGICNLALTCGRQFRADVFASNGDGLLNLRTWEDDAAIVIAHPDEIDLIRSGLADAAKMRTIRAMDFLRGVPGQLREAENIKPEAAPPTSRSGFWRLFSRGQCQTQDNRIKSFIRTNRQARP